MHSPKNPYLRALSWVGILILIGVIIQYAIGPIHGRFFRFPYNAIMGLVFLILLTAGYLYKPKSAFISKLSSAPYAIIFSVSIGVLSIMLGSLVFDNPHAYFFKLGLGNITSSWYFGLLFLCLLTNLWWAILRRSAKLNFKNIIFLVNHLGLFLALYGAILGQGDIQRLNMTLEEGKVAWQGYKDSTQIVELPFALYLEDFAIKNYPNKLYVVNEDGKILPEKGTPAQILLEKDSNFSILGWQIRLHQYLSTAIIDPKKVYTSSPMWGATAAAQVSVYAHDSLIQEKAWVAAGNAFFMPKGIRLDSTHTLVMAPAEPKQFSSQVIVYEQDSTIAPHRESIEVNHPIQVQGWKVYQTSYDERLGKWSTISIVELIRDPWLPIVYIGLFLLIIGSLLFFFKLRKA